MLGLGSALLASVLLGVPRALDTRAFGSRRSGYIRVNPASPELAGFAEELTRALRETCLAAPTGSRPTLLVEVHGLWRSAGRGGPACETVSLTACEGRRTRRLVLRYPRGARLAAAHALLRSLDEAPGKTALA